MDAFGQALKGQRQAAGMRQRDLVEALHHVIARSTLANVEVGREKPSARLWAAIQEYLPQWVPALESWYLASHRPAGDLPFELAGPYEILSASHVFTFREHRCPEELIQVRQVRALSDGCTGYGLSLGNLTGNFSIDAEALWGGWIETHQQCAEDATSSVMTRFHFDRTLRRGDVHEFATRGWVDHDEPTTSVSMVSVRPTALSTQALNFLGPRPELVWRYELTSPDDPIPDAPAARSDVLAPTPGGSCALRVARPVMGRVYGLAWAW